MVDEGDVVVTTSIVVDGDVVVVVVGAAPPPQEASTTASPVIHQADRVGVRLMSHLPAIPDAATVA